MEDWRGLLVDAVEAVLAGIDGGRSARENRNVDRLSERFGLTPFETDLLVLCAGHALVPEVATRVGGRPTFGFALAHLPGAHIDATSATGPLRSHRLLALSPGFTTLEAPLAIDERVLAFLLGITTLDERLLAYTIALPDEMCHLTDTQALVAERAGHALSRVHALQVHGGDGRSRLAVLRAAAANRSLPVLRLRAAALALPAAELELVQRLIEREVILGRVLPIIDLDVVDSADTTRAARTFVDGISTPVAIGAPDTLALTGSTAAFEVPLATAAERYERWTDALGGRDLGAERLAQQFRLEPAQIADLAATVDDETTFDDLWTACCEISRPRLDDLACRVEPAATWDSLVLAPAVIATLHDLVNQLEDRHRVHEQWGLSRGDQRGQAITALFHGPSGTGKTHAAEVIARAVKLDLLHVDLSQVVDKYVGETEKRLRRIFDEAERGGAVLLFDEADALFGKRGAIERGTDRWANVEVSYLLQRLERYHGIAILTTNARDAIDQAFWRRLRFVVPFAFPDAALRVELWRRVFPSNAPLVGVDPAVLARLQLTGASIKNIATKAAFHAAHERTAISMHHVTTAARSEFAKLEMPFSELDMRAVGRAQ